MKCPHCLGTGELAAEAIHVGSMIMAARRAKGMTQMELSEKAMMGRAQIANLEAGRSDLPTKTLIRIAEALGVRAGDLIP